MTIRRLFDILRNTTFGKQSHVFFDKLDNQWCGISKSDFISSVNRLRQGLHKMGLKRGDMVGVITSKNKSSWHILDFALQKIGVVSVPVYATSSEKDLMYIFNETKISFCFASNDLIDKISSIASKVPSLKHIVSLDENSQVESVFDIINRNSVDEEIVINEKEISEDDVVTIIYTSGTTGTPKGVMLTHKNIVSNVLASVERVPIPKDDEVRVLSFLPINHVYERMLVYLFLHQGYTIYFAESLEKIGDNLREVRPHFMSAVPRLIEKVYDKIYHKGTQSGLLKRIIFLWSLGIAKEFEIGRCSWKLWLARKLVFNKWQNGLGGKLVCIISGSAALSKELNTVFHAAGIPILEGYGLTETSPVVAVNTFGDNNLRIGSVGKPLKNVEIKLLEDGEICVKGDSIFKGYYQNQDLTKEVFTPDGYFKTGDIGKIEDGFLFITDRKKEIFKTSGGKYIAPQHIELMLVRSKYIEQAMVVGEGEKMPCAFIQPNFVLLRDWAQHKKIDLNSEDYQSIVSHPRVIEKIQKEVDKVNEKLGDWEKIKKFHLTPEVWSIELGHLTPTLKLRRKAILERYAKAYEALYDR